MKKILHEKLTWVNLAYILTFALTFYLAVTSPAVQATLIVDLGFVITAALVVLAIYCFNHGSSPIAMGILVGLMVIGTLILLLYIYQISHTQVIILA